MTKRWKRDFTAVWGVSPPVDMTCADAERLHLLSEDGRETLAFLSPSDIRAIRESFGEDWRAFEDVMEAAWDEAGLSISIHKATVGTLPQLVEAAFGLTKPVSSGKPAETMTKTSYQGYSAGSGYQASYQSQYEKKAMRHLPYRPTPYEFKRWSFDRTIIVGDLHGCADELVTLLKEVNFRPGCDRLVSVGDIVDRGPKISQCFEILREYNAWLCLGNHEEPFLKWLVFETHPDYRGKWSGSNNPIDLTYRADQRATFETLNHRDWQDMLRMQLFLKLDDIVHRPIVVHAGLHPGKEPVESQDPFAMIRMIRLDERNKSLPFSSSAGQDWWNKYENTPGNYHVVYGHSTCQTPRTLRYSTGLDTGAVYGGMLSALVLPPPGVEGQWKIHSVPAKRHYLSSAAEVSGGQTFVL